MRGSRARPGILFYRFRLCFQWVRMHTGYANRKRCIIVDAEYRHRPSEVSRVLWETNFFFLFFVRRSRFRFARLYCIYLRVFIIFYGIRRFYEVRSWNNAPSHCSEFDEGLLLNGEHACFRIPFIGYNIYRFWNKRSMREQFNFLCSKNPRKIFLSAHALCVYVQIKIIQIVWYCLIHFYTNWGVSSWIYI